MVRSFQFSAPLASKKHNKPAVVALPEQRSGGSTEDRTSSRSDLDHDDNDA